MEALTITSSAVSAAQLHSPEWKSAVGFQSVLGTESAWNSQSTQEELCQWNKK